MIHGAAEIKKMTGVPAGMSRSHSVNAAGDNAGKSVSNLLKALTGAPVPTKGGFSNER